MVIEFITLVAAMLATGIETAFVPSDGGEENTVRVEPDLVSAGSLTPSRVIFQLMNGMLKSMYLCRDHWPAAVERTVIEAASRPKATRAGT